LSGQAGEVKDRDAKDGPNGPEGRIPTFRSGAIVSDGGHDTVSRCSDRDYIPRLFQNDYVGKENGFVRVFAREICAFCTKSCEPAYSSGRLPRDPEKPIFGHCNGPAAGPLLRRKSRLCYTADAISPF
jgi:hypothetical protein